MLLSLCPRVVPGANTVCIFTSRRERHSDGHWLTFTAVGVVSGTGAGAGYDPAGRCGWCGVRRRGWSFSGAGGAYEGDLADDDRPLRPPTCPRRVVVSVLPLPPLVPRGYAEATTPRRNQYGV